MGTLETPLTREQVHAEVAKNLRIRFHTVQAPASLEDLALRPSEDTAIIFPVGLRESTFHFTPGCEMPNTGVQVLSETMFRSMFPNGKEADVAWLDDLRPVKANPGNDELWGIINTPNLQALTRMLSHAKPESVLQIGVGLGIDTVIFAQCLEKGSIIAGVDPGPDAVTQIPVSTMNKTYQAYGQENLGKFIVIAREQEIIGAPSNGSDVMLIREDSVVYLPQLHAEGERFDFVFVDGNHGHRAAEIDIYNSFALLADGGILVVDDWNKHPNSINVMEGLMALSRETGYMVFNLEHFQNADLKANIAFMIKSEEFRTPDAVRGKQDDLVEAARGRAFGR